MTINRVSPEETAQLLSHQETGGKKMSEHALTTIETEAVSELLKASLGGTASVLTELFSEQVFVTSPTLVMTNRDDVFSQAVAPFYVALSEYSGAMSGMQILSVSQKDVDAALQTPETDKAEDSDFQAVQQLIERMFESVAQSMSILFETTLAHALTGMDLVERAEDFALAKFTQEQWFVEGIFALNVNGKQTIPFHLCIPVPLAKRFAHFLTESGDGEEIEEMGDMPKQTDNPQKESSSTPPTVQNVQFSSFDNTETPQAEPNNLNMLLDIPLQVTVELGRTKRIVKDILEISQGSIIELDKLAGEPVDILVNNKRIAVGEVVVIDENFGVRVTDVLSTAERMSKLR